MKQFFLSLLVLLTFSINSQVDLKCYTYDSFTSSDCYGCEPNASSVSYSVLNIATGNVATGTLTTDIPTQSTLLGLMGAVSAAGSSRAISSALAKVVLETNY